MSSDAATPRSRRALLATAAGAAGALAVSAIAPLSVAAADPNDVVMGTDNPTTATTSITDSTADSTAFAAHATGGGVGYGIEATSTAAGGLVGWSIEPPDSSWYKPEFTAYTGVFGSAPSNPDPDILSTAVWGDSPDIGVFGSGGNGVVGYGGIGVEGDANDLAGSIGVWAWAPTTSQVALKVTGKVSLSRSGRTSMASNKSSLTVSLTGVTSSSKVFAVLASSESGRYVRAVVASSGKFTIYLNTKLTSSATVNWFVLD
jgi:hypothetical protein